MYYQLTTLVSRRLSMITLIALGLVSMKGNTSLGNPPDKDKATSAESSTASQVCDPQAISALKADQLLLHVEGMVCGMCVQGISKILGELEGVKGVEIDLEAGSVLVTMKPEGKLAEQDFKDAVSRAGYEMRDMHRPAGEGIKEK